MPPFQFKNPYLEGFPSTKEFIEEQRNRDMDVAYKQTIDELTKNGLEYDTNGRMTMPLGFYSKNLSTFFPSNTPYSIISPSNKRENIKITDKDPNYRIYVNEYGTPMTDGKGNLLGTEFKVSLPKSNSVQHLQARTDKQASNNETKAVEARKSVDLSNEYSADNFLNQALVSGTVEPSMRFMSPSQYVGAAFDAAQGKRGFLQSLTLGNSGFVTDNFAANHPLLSAGINLVGDVGSYYGLAKGIKGGLQLADNLYNKSGLAYRRAFNQSLAETPLEQMPLVVNPNKITLSEIPIKSDIPFGLTNPAREYYYWKGPITDPRNFDTPLLKQDIQAGKQDFIDWINSPEYRSATLSNKAEAEAMGLSYTPIQEKPSYQKAISNFSPYIIFDESKSAQGWVYPSNEPGIINLNGFNKQSLRQATEHELAHSARLAWSDPKLKGEVFNPKELEYLQYKNSEVFKDTAIFPNGYNFTGSKMGQPHEATVNMRNLGEVLGIKVGEPYPGDEKVLEYIDKVSKNPYYTGIARHLNLNNLKAVWKALNGTQWVLVPAILATQQND